MADRSAPVAVAAGGEEAVFGVVGVEGDADLPQVVAALVRKLASRTFWMAGKSKPIRTAMMAITTSSSISVKPPRRRDRPR